MARLDVHRWREGSELLLDCQSDLLDNLATRLMVPLRPAAEMPAPIPRLHPVLPVGGEPHVMVTDLAAAVPVREIGARIASVAAHHDAVLAALDMLITGV